MTTWGWSCVVVVADVARFAGFVLIYLVGTVSVSSKVS